MICSRALYPFSPCFVYRRLDLLRRYMKGAKVDAMEKAAERVSTEISRLKEQRHAVQKEAERVGERFKELSDRRSTFGPNILSNDSEGAEKLTTVMGDLVKALDEESEVLSCTKARAEDAVLELDRLIMQAEVQYHQLRKRLAQRRYEALCKERYAHDDDAEEVVGVLVQVLHRLEGLYAEQVHAAVDAEKPSPPDPRTTVECWLARRLHHWLSLESLEKYDAPLPELDPLALKPESERKSVGTGGAEAPADPKRPGPPTAISGATSRTRRVGRAPTTSKRLEPGELTKRSVDEHRQSGEAATEENGGGRS
jgi:hypothetical protein